MSSQCDAGSVPVLVDETIMTPDTEKRIAEIRKLLSLGVRISVGDARFLLSIIHDLRAENELLETKYEEIQKFIIDSP